MIIQGVEIAALDAQMAFAIASALTEPALNATTASICAVSAGSETPVTGRP